MTSSIIHRVQIGFIQITFVDKVDILVHLTLLLLPHVNVSMQQIFEGSLMHGIVLFQYFFILSSS